MKLSGHEDLRERADVEQDDPDFTLRSIAPKAEIVLGEFADVLENQSSETGPPLLS